MMFDAWAQSLEALSSSRGILTILGAISLWAWTLILFTTLNLNETIRSLRHASDDCVFTDHARFCCSLSRTGLSARVKKRLTATHARGVVQSMADGVSTILVLSSLAPLLGLLGTVDGVITTFEALAVNDMGGDALTSGISKALITTQGGLLVAIPTLLAGGILYRKVGKLRDKLRLAALLGTAGDTDVRRLRGAA